MTSRAIRFFAVFSMATMTLTALAPQSAWADDNDDGTFEDGSGQAPDNADSENVPGLQLGIPTYAGTGCPQGSARAVLSPDQKALTVLFDQYTVRAGGGVSTARATCNMKIPVNIPSGYRMQVVKIEYRGFTHVPQGASSIVSAGLRFASRAGGNLPMKRHGRQKRFNGPIDKNFIVASRLQGASFTPCGESIAMISESAIEVASRRGEDVLSAIDSADSAGMPVRMHLRWKRCGHGESDDKPGNKRAGRQVR